MKKIKLIFYTFIKFILFNKNKKKYILFSESKYYRNHFEKLIENLRQKFDKEVYYLTSDFDDYNFFKTKINTYYIGTGIIRYLTFYNFNCENLILTLTDIGNHLPKSKNCNNYIYFFHALMSTHLIYTKEAFKNYNTIFSNGTYQEKELRKAEKIFNFHRKKIINIGYFYFDYLQESINHKIVQKNLILFAPSWNYDKNNFFDNHSSRLIRKLLDENYSIIFRPHPEHYKRSKGTLKKIINQFGKSKHFFFDESISNINSMEKSEVLITDNSGSMLEFTLVLNRPCLCFDEIKKIHNPNYKDLDIEPLEEIFIKDFVKKLKISEIENVREHCVNVLKNYKDSQTKVINFREKYISNIGHSVKSAMDYLVNLKNQKI